MIPGGLVNSKFLQNVLRALRRRISDAERERENNIASKIAFLPSRHDRGETGRSGTEERLARFYNAAPPPSDGTRRDAFAPSVTFNLSQRFTADVILKFHSRLLPHAAAPRRDGRDINSTQLSSSLTSSKQFQFSLFSLSPAPNAAKAICPNLERLSRQWRLDRRRRQRSENDTNLAKWSSLGPPKANAQAGNS